MFMFIRVSERHTIATLTKDITLNRSDVCITSRLIILYTQHRRVFDLSHTADSPV